MLNFANARPFTMEDFKHSGMRRCVFPNVPVPYPKSLECTRRCTIRISGVSFSELNHKIGEFLHQTEELKEIKWDDMYCNWTMEYGSTPPEYKHENSKHAWAIERCRRIYWRAAMVARKQNGDMEDLFDFEPHRRWTKLQLTIYADRNGSNDYILHFMRSTGDWSSHQYIWEQLERVLSPENVRVWVRGAFMKLLSDGISENDPPQLQYLFNDLIARDICTYLEGDSACPGVGER